MNRFFKADYMIQLHLWKDHSVHTVENKLATYCSKLCKKWEGPRLKQWQCAWGKKNQVYRSLVNRNSGLSRVEVSMQVSVIKSEIQANAV